MRLTGFKNRGPNASKAEPAFPFYSDLHLEDRLFSFILVRFLVAGAMIGGAFFAPRVVGVRNLPTRELVLLALFLAFFNTIAFGLVRPYWRNRERALNNRRFLTGVMIFSMATDFLLLTVALYLVGGPLSPFKAFFLFHVIIAGILLSPKQAYVLTAFGYFLFSGLVLGTWLEWFPAHQPEGAVPAHALLDGRYVVTLLVVQGLLFVLSAILVTSLMMLLRDAQRRLYVSNRELDRLSRQRQDFLRITLHDLRAPVGAVSMLLANLDSDVAGELNDVQKNWVGRCRKRIAELTVFLKDLEFLGALEAGGLEKQLQSVDLAGILAALEEEYHDLAEEHGHRLVFDVPEGVPPVRGVSRLLQESIANFITNAIKYSTEPDEIQVRLKKRGDRVRVEVQDHGVGIAPEAQKRLFQEFVRVHEKKGRLANVPGSGLGLYIVHQIVELHGGRIDVISASGQGSTFAIELPAA